MRIFKRNLSVIAFGKHFMVGDKHLADVCDEKTAEVIAICLNYVIINSKNTEKFFEQICQRTEP